MKKVFLSVAVFVLLSFASFAQKKNLQIEGKEVAKNEDVVFHQIDEHTWVGSGHIMSNESLYLVEGNKKAVLIDAGTKIADLDKIVASITKKPILLVATHLHPDHTGSAVHSFPEIYINEAEAASMSQFMPDYKGKILYFEDGEIFDLGGRKLEVVFTPGHTPGSTTFMDKDAGYGFSGDSFGSGNLLLSGSFSTLIATCRKVSAMMEKYGIKFLYPGHFYGQNVETKQRLEDMITLSRDVLSGKVKGDAGPRGLIVSAYGVRINYSEKSMQ